MLPLGFSTICPGLWKADKVFRMDPNLIAQIKEPWNELGEKATNNRLRHNMCYFWFLIADFLVLLLLMLQVIYSWLTLVGLNP